MSEKPTEFFKRVYREIPEQGDYAVVINLSSGHSFQATIDAPEGIYVEVTNSPSRLQDASLPSLSAQQLEDLTKAGFTSQVGVYVTGRTAAEREVGTFFEQAEQAEEWVACNPGTYTLTEVDWNPRMTASSLDELAEIFEALLPSLGEVEDHFHV